MQILSQLVNCNKNFNCFIITLNFIKEHVEERKSKKAEIVDESIIISLYNSIAAFFIKDFSKKIHRFFSF